MKTIARIFLAVILFQQSRFANSKENNRLLPFLKKYKERFTLPTNVNNNFIYQFPKEKRTFVNAYDSWAFPKPYRKYSNQFHVAIEKRTSLISPKIQREIMHRKLLNRHNKSLQTMHRRSENTQRRFLENEAFFNKFEEPTQNKCNKSNEKSKRATIVNDAVVPEIPRKVSKPCEMNENYPISHCAKQQTKTTFLLPTILNVLRKALLVHPFKQWKLKHKFSSMKDILVHENTLHEVIRNPWNERLKHKLYKVLQGEDVYLDVLGGSHSTGAGLEKDKADVEGRYDKVIRHWWNKTITPITGSNFKLREIARSATSSEFYQFCFASYIHEHLDLVFIELADNDVRELPSNANNSLPLEQLTRQLLVYPKEPALVYINLFHCMHCDCGCTNIEDYGQDLITDTYNITSLKWRNAVCSKNAKNNFKTPCDFISSDGMHINQLGHAHISLMLINLFRKILLDHISSVITNLGLSGLIKPTRVSREKKPTYVTSQITVSVSDHLQPGILRKQVALPRPVYIKKTTKIISDPLCWTNLSPSFHRIDDIKNNLDVIITKTKGFFLETWKPGEKCNKPPCRMDSVSNWISKTVGANITFAFTVPGGNSSLSVGEIQTRSVAVGIRTSRDGGAANMWLDSDHKSKKCFTMKLFYEQTRARILALHVKPGNHSLNIEVAREGKVSIVAIMVGPSDGPY